jgi:hypothetical protein
MKRRDDNQPESDRCSTTRQRQGPLCLLGPATIMKEAIAQMLATKDSRPSTPFYENLKPKTDSLFHCNRTLSATFRLKTLNEQALKRGELVTHHSPRRHEVKRTHSTSNNTLEQALTHFLHMFATILTIQRYCRRRQWFHPPLNMATDFCIPIPENSPPAVVPSRDSISYDDRNMLV